MVIGENKDEEDTKDKKHDNHEDKSDETDVLVILRNITMSTAEEDAYILEGSCGMRRCGSRDRLFNSNRGIPHDLPEEYFW